MVSFVIPARNEEALIGQTIEAIRRAAPALQSDYEIVVVNDGSTDATAAVATANGASVVDVNLRQIAAVRNAGTRAARGEFLFFIDADTLVSGELLAAARSALEGGAVGGGCRVHWDSRTPLHVRIAAHAFGFFWFRLCRWAAGCFIFVRREAFAAAGGFDERYYASEEMYFSRALKRVGKFVILRQSVETSARKARLYSARQHLALVWHLIFKPRGFRNKEGLGYWYDDRREASTKSEARPFGTAKKGK